MTKITRKTIWKQLKYDLIGKDSQRGITLTYGWLANQFGHFGLGYIPTTIFFIIYSVYFPQISEYIWAPLTTVIIWTCFEAYNFLVPLLKHTKSDTFEPDWKNVGYDTCTDLIFFYTGAFAAGMLHSFAYEIVIPFAIFFISTFFLFNAWYPVKMYIQYALFPFQFRLSQWVNPISEKDKQTILNLIETNNKQHFLLFGCPKSGKTSLAVSIATEFTIRKRIAFYTTAIKTARLFEMSDSELQKSYSLEWSWRQADILVIDDIDIGGDNPDIITPTFFDDLHKKSQYKAENYTAIQNQSVMWVVGNIDNKSVWINYLIEIGIKEQNIVCIELE